MKVMLEVLNGFHQNLRIQTIMKLNRKKIRSLISKLLWNGSVILIVTAVACAQKEKTIRKPPPTRPHTINKSIGQLELIPSRVQSPTANIVSISMEDSFRVIRANGIPNHLTGAFPNNDNPNKITNRPQVWSLYEAYGTEEEYVWPTDGEEPDYASEEPPWYNFTYDEPDHISYLSGGVSFHIPQGSASSGIPTSFPLFDPTVNPLNRALIGEDEDGDFPNHPYNANNAARNLLEIIANEVRSDTSGKFPIRIYTLGLGDILNENMGTINETGASILRRVANQQANNPFYDPTQLEGKYYYAGDTDQLNAAFREVASQITRLSQ